LPGARIDQGGAVSALAAANLRNSAVLAEVSVVLAGVSVVLAEISGSRSDMLTTLTDQAGNIFRSARSASNVPDRPRTSGP